MTPGGKGEQPMTTYKEAGGELVQARGEEGRFEYQGLSLRLGVFHDDAGWYIGVHMSSGRLCARLSLEHARSQKEAKDMLKYGFFLRTEELVSRKTENYALVLKGMEAGMGSSVHPPPVRLTTNRPLPSRER